MDCICTQLVENGITNPDCPLHGAWYARENRKQTPTHPMNAQDALDRLATIYDRQLLPAQAVAEATTVYLEMGERIAELDVIRASAKQVVNDVLAELGYDRFESDAGLVYVSKPSIRIGYDAGQRNGARRWAGGQASEKRTILACTPREDPQTL